jgi:hypothetical protein
LNFKFKYPDIFFIFVLIFFSLIATRSLWHPGIWTSHDGPHQVVRLYYYWQSVRDGYFPARYILDSLRGFGYPLFIFSYHLPWIVSLPFLFFGLSIYDCIKIVTIITFIVSGLTMYWWQKRLWSDAGGAWPAFVGAFLYLWAPYRFSDIFVRGALGEAMCFMFLPIIFNGLTIFTSEVEAPRNKVDLNGFTKSKNIIKTLLFSPRRWFNCFVPIILIAIGIAGVILSHALIFVLLLPALIAYIVFQWLNNFHLPAPSARADSGQVKKYIKTVLCGFALGFGLSAFYLLPAFFLKKETIFDRLMSGSSLSFTDHFPSLRQLLYSVWGYGFSFQGPNDGMSFQVGIAQWLVIFLSITIIIVITVIAIIKKSRGLWQSKLPTAVFFLFLFFFSIFMMLPASRPAWLVFQKFAYIDYPWRYLFLSVFSASVLAGWPVWLIKEVWKIKKIGILTGVFLIVTALYTNRNHLKVNLWLDWDPQSFIGEGETSNSFDEYRLAIADREYIKEKQKPVEILKGRGEISAVLEKTSQMSFQVKNLQDSLYRVNKLYFPEVRFLVDGRPAKFTYQDKGVLEFALSQGQHQVEIYWQRTLLEKVALSISVITFITIIIVIFIGELARGRPRGSF